MHSRVLGSMKSTACTVNETTFCRTALTITAKIPKILLSRKCLNPPICDM